MHNAQTHPTARRQGQRIKATTVHPPVALNIARRNQIPAEALNLIGCDPQDLLVVLCVNPDRKLTDIVTDDLVAATTSSAAAILLTAIERTAAAAVILVVFAAPDTEYDLALTAIAIGRQIEILDVIETVAFGRTPEISANEGRH